MINWCSQKNVGSLTNIVKKTKIQATGVGNIVTNIYLTKDLNLK